MPHLESLAPKSTRASDRGRFPFTVPVIRSLGTVDLSSPVTFFVGENGSGKSTLLEALALAAQLPTVGTEEEARGRPPPCWPTWSGGTARSRMLARTVKRS